MKLKGLLIKLLPYFLGAVTVAAVGVTVWVVWFRQPDVVPLIPDYAPIETDQNATPIEGDTGGEKVISPEGGGSLSIYFTFDVAVNKDTGKVSLLFQNPNKSNQNTVLELLIRDTVIARSQLIPSGYMVNTMDLLPDAAERLEKGGYDGIMRVLSYNPGTGEKAVVNTEVEVRIEVR